MLLPKEAYVKFQALFRKHYGKDINMGDAIQKGDQLIRYLKAIHKIQAKEYDQNHVQRKEK